MNLKIGGNNVGKIMYGGQEFGGATKLEPGTIVYISETAENNLESVHLLSTTKNWNNLNGINIMMMYSSSYALYGSINISSDDFKSLDTEKKYHINDYISVTVSRSIVDGEYRLNIDAPSNYSYRFTIEAI